MKLKESQVEQVFHLITKCKQSEQAALLQALKSMTITRVSVLAICMYVSSDQLEDF